MNKSRIPGFVQHFASDERRKKRAMVKAIGIRQFKKVMRKLGRRSNPLWAINHE